MTGLEHPHISFDFVSYSSAGLQFLRYLPRATVQFFFLIFLNRILSLEAPSFVCARFCPPSHPIPPCFAILTIREKDHSYV